MKKENENTLIKNKTKSNKVKHKAIFTFLVKQFLNSK